MRHFGVSLKDFIILDETLKFDMFESVYCRYNDSFSKLQPKDTPKRYFWS